jgi:hypothetical protein
VIQMLRSYVDRTQNSWAKHLGHVAFNLNNAVNATTGKRPFEILYNESPRAMPPLGPRDESSVPAAFDFVAELQTHDLMIQEVRDNILAAKMRQTNQANKHRRDDDEYRIGDLVMLDTADRRRQYKQKGKKRAAKLFPRNDGPWEVVRSNPDKSSYTLDLKGSKVNPTFHASKLRRYVPNDADRFPQRDLKKPGPVLGLDGDADAEYKIDKLVDERKRRAGRKTHHEYLVRWDGYDESNDTWQARSELLDTEALAKWKARG